MNADPHASARRVAQRAIFLLIPIVAVAVIGPRVVRWARSVALPSVPTLAPRGDVGIAAPARDGPAKEEPPKPPEAPTPEQIVQARKAQVDLGKAQKGWESVTVLSPRDGKVGEDGLVTLPFEGFGLSVESAPAGATVSVNGAARGETPLLASVDCAAGETLTVRVEKPPLPAWERKVRCRADALVKLSATLRPR